MPTYISIDVATKSLAIGIYRMMSFKNIQHDKDPIKLNSYLDSLIQPLMMNVYDLNKGSKLKDTSIHAKAISLKDTLASVDKTVDACCSDDEIVVLIEYQMNSNHTANAIFNMVMYHYAGRYPIHTMRPSWKNTISFHPELTLSMFLARSSTNYKANKDHTKTNMLYLLTLIDKLDCVSHIKKTNLDDIADTLMQAIAFHVK